MNVSMDFPIQCDIDWLKSIPTDELIQAMLWFKHSFNSFKLKTHIVTDNIEIETINKQHTQELLLKDREIININNNYALDKKNLQMRIDSLNESIDVKVNDQIDKATKIVQKADIF